MDIQELLDESFIEFNLNSSTKMEAIAELADLLVEKEVVGDRSEYLAKVLKREAECTTGIGMGIAIPHGKSSVVNKASIAFGRNLQGIEYDSLDGQPVNLIFLIAVPDNSNDQHLKILSHLSRKLIHKEVREKLLKAETAEEVYEAFK